MSRRTSEASKAIRATWLKEQEFPNDVNDGKAFEGHHMKSAEAYPEYQGDSENIQLLSRPEHQEALGGDYRNLTNGYFNPVTKITRDFGG